MSETPHIAHDAAGLAALPPGDPERVAAAAHAAGCPTCGAAWAEALRLPALLAHGAPAAPSPEALARIATALDREIAADLAAARGRRPTAITLAAAAVATWAAPLFLHSAAPQLRAAGRADWVTSAVFGAIAAFATAMVVTSGAAWLALAPLASATLTAAASATRGLHPALGRSCLTFELGIAAVSVVVARLAARRWSLPFSPVLAAGAAAGGALVGHACLHLLCEETHALEHLWVFHTGGVVLAGALAAGATRLVGARAGR